MTMSTNPPSPQGEPESTSGDPVVADAIQQLLDSFTSSMAAQEEESPASAVGAVSVPEETERAHRADFAAASAELRSIVERIRGHFLQLADAEVRRLLEAVLLGSMTEAPRPVTAPPPAERPVMSAPVEPSIELPQAEAPPAAPVETAEIEEAAPEAPAPTSDEELYEGSVRLTVVGSGNMQQVVQFVDELCQKPEFRMLRMTGNPQQEGAEISLGLRESLPFKSVLLAMATVAEVSSPEQEDDTERSVTVWLSQAPLGA